MTDWYLPAEWEPQDAVWLSWPLNPDAWPGRLPLLQAKFAEIASHISHCEFVHINAAAENHPLILKQIQEAGGNPAHVRLFPHPTNDVWCRDHGPIFVKNRHTGQIALTDWQFNAWGGKFFPWNLDNAIPEQIAAALHIPRLASQLILEGGSIEGNGAGTILTTEAVLLNPNRNPTWSRRKIEAELQRLLGITDIFWLEQGIKGDDTDGHIDDMTRFFRTDAIVTAVDPGGPNDAILQANLERLQDLRTTDGRPTEIIQLPMPHPLIARDWRLDILPASYANFLILNETVLAPVFGQPKRDAPALEILRSCFPSRNVIGIDCCDIVFEGGALHCISQHQPA